VTICAPGGNVPRSAKQRQVSPQPQAAVFAFPGTTQPPEQAAPDCVFMWAATGMRIEVNQNSVAIMEGLGWALVPPKG
jgi:hypothetical protein